MSSADTVDICTYWRCSTLHHTLLESISFFAKHLVAVLFYAVRHAPAFARQTWDGVQQPTPHGTLQVPAVFDTLPHIKHDGVLIAMCLLRQPAPVYSARVWIWFWIRNALFPEFPMLCKSGCNIVR